MSLTKQRQALKRFILEEVGPSCESCNERPGTDLHEVFVKRSDVPKRRQREIFVRSNCALVCQMCHGNIHTHAAPVDSDEFKRRFSARLRQLGYEPMIGL